MPRGVIENASGHNSLSIKKKIKKVWGQALSSKGLAGYTISKLIVRAEPLVVAAATRSPHGVRSARGEF